MAEFDLPAPYINTSRENLVRKKRILLLVSVLIATTILIANYLNIMPLSKNYPAYFGWLPHQTSSPANLPVAEISEKPDQNTLTFEGCNLKKEKNPLVDDVSLINNKVVGVLRGNINHVTVDETKESAVIELISPRGDQVYTFRSMEETGLVYDAVALKNLKLTDLKPGQTVSASFNCSPRVSNSFKIVRLAVTSR